MTTPTDLPPVPDEPVPLPVARVQELRDRLRPRGVGDREDPTLSAGERFALERIQALELQLSSAHQRERDLTEVAVRDGNRLAQLHAKVADLADRAERADVAEKALFEAENRAETAIRRAELMETELRSSRGEVDRLRERVVELEASLRRALAEVGEATTVHARSQAADASREAVEMERSAERSIELADRLRLQVVDLEGSLRTVMAQLGDAAATRLRAEQAIANQQAGTEARERSVVGQSRAAEAEERLAELEERLASLDTRIAGLNESLQGGLPEADSEETSDDAPSGEPSGEPESAVVDLREAEAEAQAEGVKPPVSRWSEWRAT